MELRICYNRLKVFSLLNLALGYSCPFPAPIPSTDKSVSCSLMSIRATSVCVSKGWLLFVGHVGEGLILVALAISPQTATVSTHILPLAEYPISGDGSGRNSDRDKQPNKTTSICGRISRCDGLGPWRGKAVSIRSLLHVAGTNK